MMSEAEALETLAREDPAVASDAKAALRWLTSGGGLEVISQLRLQEFLWQVLPTSWPLSGPGQLAVARALGRLLELAGLNRYAQACTAPVTEQVIGAYDASLASGVNACQLAVDASQVVPPDTDLLAWGTLRGPEEQAAYEACSAAIELALTCGELRIGASGWKIRRSALVDRWLTAPGIAGGQPATGWGHESHPSSAHPSAPHPAPPPGPEPLEEWAEWDEADEDDLPGTWPGHGPRASEADTLIARISAERLDEWAHPRPGDRSRMARRILPRLLDPPPVPPDTLPALRWLLRRADAGLALTSRHYLAPAEVAEAAQAFGWAVQDGKRLQELAVPPLHTLRCLAQREMGALRRTGTRLVLTRTGRLMADDAGIRWHIATCALIGPDDGPEPDFAAAVREAALLMLTLTGDAMSYPELASRLASLHAAEGWTANARRGLRPTSRRDLEPAVRCELQGLARRLRALHLLVPAGAPGDLALNAAGMAGALSALLSRALRPRH